MTRVRCSPNAEVRVLATLIMLGDYKKIPVQKAMHLLTPDCFTNPHNKNIYLVIRSRYDNSDSFDHTTIEDSLLLQNSPQLIEHYYQIITTEFYSTANLDSYIDELILAKQLRKKISALETIMVNSTQATTNQDADQTINEGIKELADISLNIKNDGKMFSEIGELFFDGHYKDQLIPTNIKDFDDALNGGIQNSCLVTICGDTGVGKTYFALYLMYMLGNNNPDKQSLYFNLEMKEIKNWQRLIGIIAGNPFDQLTTDERLKAHTQGVAHPITIYEEQHNDIDDIITLARTKSIDLPLSVIVIDYISLVESRNSFERPDLKQIEITKRLVRLAIELNCIIIVTSQTNRNPESRSLEDRCPYMKDAAESSGNYRSAEIWIGIDRPELYNPEPFFKNKFVAKLRKNRNGLLPTIVWEFNKGTFPRTLNTMQFMYESKKDEEHKKSMYQNPFGSKKDYQSLKAGE